MRGYYISLEPEQRLAKHIRKLKKKVANFNGAVYADHPPHMTLCVFEKNLDKMIKYIDKMAFYRIPMDITGWVIYEKDIMTKKDTLICDIMDSYGLISKLYNTILSTTEAHSKNIYAFSGIEWKPHITIASIHDFAKIYKKVYRQIKCPTGRWTFTQISIRDRDTHKIIKKWPLK